MSDEYRVINDVEFIIPMSELLDRDKRARAVKRTALDRIVRDELSGYHLFSDGKACILVEDLPALFEKLGFNVA